MQELMAVLKEQDVHATFFLVGKFAERYSGITLSLSRAGHELENHSYTHPRLYTFWIEKIMREAERCDEVLENLSLPKSRFLRPPGGAFNLKVFNAMRRMNLRLGLWNVNTADYTGKPAQDISPPWPSPTTATCSAPTSSTPPPPPPGSSRSSGN